MSKVPVLIFTIFALVNITVASPGDRAKLIVELTEKIGQLQLNVTTTWLGESNAINDYKNQITSLIKNSDQSVLLNLNTLNKLVEDTKVKAKKQNKMIYDCVENEGDSVRKNVTVKKIDECSSKFSLEIVRAKLTQLLGIKTEANTFVLNCGIKNPVDDYTFESCVMYYIQNSYNDVEKIKNDIDKKATKIVQNSEHCVKTNLKTVNNEIKRITKVFNNCVNAA